MLVWKQLADQVLSGNRIGLARAITLVESGRPDHRKAASLLLEKVIRGSRLPQPDFENSTYRIGISGPPGVGKSTFIEALGSILCSECERKVGVLAIDPSSLFSGGAIMGDKTRMIKLAREPNAFVRPSATRGTLGGVARSTLETIYLSEAAGFHTTLVETVGVGQSETMIDDVVDFVILIVPPGGGDQLQGVKKGITEVADLVLVNKAEAGRESQAKTTASEYSSAFHLSWRKNEWWTPRAMTCSAQYRIGIREAWDVIQEHSKKSAELGHLSLKRSLQRKKQFWSLIDQSLHDRFVNHPAVVQKITSLEDSVLSGSSTPGSAADKLLDSFFDRISDID